jgi:hypothetical protein
MFSDLISRIRNQCRIQRALLRPAFEFLSLFESTAWGQQQAVVTSSHQSEVEVAIAIRGSFFHSHLLGL